MATAPVPPPCGDCVWKYVDQVWTRVDHCKYSDCQCPDSIEDDKDKSSGKLLTYQNQETAGATKKATGLPDSNFRGVVKRLVEKGIRVEHRKFASADKRVTDPAKVKSLSPTILDSSNFKTVAYDDTTTFTWRCVRAKPGPAGTNIFQL